MLTRSHDKIEIECDLCDEVLETGTADFGEAITILKNEGWQSKKLKDNWEHRCPRHAD